MEKTEDKITFCDEEIIFDTKSEVNSSNVLIISSLKDILLKDYLFKLYKKETDDDHLKIKNVIGINPHSIPIAHKPQFDYDRKNGLYLIIDRILVFSVIYDLEEYEISFIAIQKWVIDIYEHEYKMFASGNNAKAISPATVLKYILEQGIKASNFRGKVIKHNLTDQKDFYYNLSIIVPKKISIENLFIPFEKKEQIERFVYAVKSYSNDKIPLRYLLSGVPGTGKTQLINSIINVLNGEATILISSGGNFRMGDIFEFCGLFEPCVLIIDDIDFAVNNRDENNDKRFLGEFLQYLDGFVTNNLFLLAATNDKKLVDAAASRPGRFDLIIDLNEIEPEHYLSLIQRETDDKDIIKFFNEDVLTELKYKKVTGAFIVSLVKQLKSAKKMKGTIANEDFDNYFRLAYSGFYKNNSESFLNMVGF